MKTPTVMAAPLDYTKKPRDFLGFLMGICVTNYHKLPPNRW